MTTSEALFTSKEKERAIRELSRSCLLLNTLNLDTLTYQKRKWAVHESTYDLRKYSTLIEADHMHLHRVPVDPLTADIISRTWDNHCI
jgi:hypothetical protein